MYDQERSSGDGPGKGGGKASPRAHGALARVAQTLSDPQQRQSFRSDPAGTVSGYEELPEQIRSTLEKMSDEELDLLTRTHQAFADAGFYHEVEDEGGKVGIF